MTGKVKKKEDYGDFRLTYPAGALKVEGACLTATGVTAAAIREIMTSKRRTLIVNDVRYMITCATVELGSRTTFHLRKV